MSLAKWIAISTCLVALLGGSAYAQDKKIFRFKPQPKIGVTVPEFKLEDAVKVEKSKDTYNKNIISIEREAYTFDRNVDGRNDLIFIKHFYPEQPYEEDTIMPAHEEHMLFIDENFDGKYDWLLWDIMNNTGEPGADGTYDMASDVGKISE